jgi:hypothetical protein
MTKHALHRSLLNLPMPARLQRLPITEEGYPKLFFAPVRANGEVVIRSVDVAKFHRCTREKLCWLCGEPLERLMTFVASVAAAYTKKVLEPPCHYDCAVYATKACPFLTNPNMKFRTADWDNPKAHALYTTSYYTIELIGNSWPAAIITMGIPEIAVEWISNHRPLPGHCVLPTVE